MQFPWNRMENELKRELAHHIHELTAEFERRGHAHEEALRMAKRIRRRVLRAEGEDRLHDEAERQFGLPATSLAYSVRLPAPLYEPARVASN